MAGHYESSGYLWEVGEIPKCSYCEEPATRSTPTSGIHLCDDEECGMHYLGDECDEIIFVDEDDNIQKA